MFYRKLKAKMFKLIVKKNLRIKYIAKKNNERNFDISCRLK